MVDFQFLSSDRKVQRTRFQGGWTVEANFDRTDRTEGIQPLPPQGFSASDGRERIERVRIGGKTVSMVRLTDRWFVDPEGGSVDQDGIASSGAVLLRREGDSLLHLAMVGDQDRVLVDPPALPWPANIVSVEREFDSAPLATEADPSGRIILSRAKGGAFYKLRGRFAPLGVGAIRRISRGRVFARGSGWHLQWNAGGESAVKWRRVDLRGRVLARWEGIVGPGDRAWALPAGHGPGWVLLDAEGRQERYKVAW